MCMDGTFDACLALFAQLLTIHAVDQDKLVPVVYALLADKRHDTYVNVFDILKNEAVNLSLQLQPTTILSDFEAGFVSAVRSAFPMSRHRGCHLHFCQSIYRQVQALGLVRNYEANPEIRLQVRQLMALTFLPVAIVRMTFHLLQSQANPVLLGLFEYFERQWMTSTVPALWKVHGNDVWRTNNHCEGWHNRFNRAISKHHPNIWLFLRAIQQEQAATEL